jgi:hypothetical protein
MMSYKFLVKCNNYTVHVAVQDELMVHREAAAAWSRRVYVCVDTDTSDLEVCSEVSELHRQVASLRSSNNCLVKEVSACRDLAAVEEAKVKTLASKGMRDLMHLLLVAAQNSTDNSNCVCASDESPHCSHIHTTSLILIDVYNRNNPYTTAYARRRMKRSAGCLQPLTNVTRAALR